MITREEYNKALDIVEAYHKQIFIGGVMPSKPDGVEPTYDKREINKGDFVICLSKNTNNKSLTVGKKYFVFECNHYNKYAKPRIKNDKNKSYPLVLEKGQWRKVY